MLVDLKNLEDALHALLSKWIVKALNQIALKFTTIVDVHNLKFHLDKKKQSKHLLTWILTFDFHAPCSFRIWDHIIKV